MNKNGDQILISSAQVRAARGLLNWTQSELAARCNLTKATIANIENEKHHLTSKTANKIHNAFTNAKIEFSDIATLFGQEVIGGIGLGLFLGWITYKLMKSIDNYEVEVILTISAVMGGTMLAHKFHLSAPLAMVTAGLIVGNDTIRSSAMSETTEAYVDKFWELIDVLLNTILFVMIGMEMLVLTLEGNYIYAGLLAIPIILLCRYLSLWLPVKFFAKRLDFVPKTNLIMTWGGLRGGISIALALSLTTEMHRELFLVITYIVVVVSIVGQGLTVEPIIKRLTRNNEAS